MFLSEGIGVVSLFDGMSCGRIALARSGIGVKNYYASEIDKHAIIVAKANWPQTQHMGDVTKWREWSIDWSKVKLVLGGSPCQGFSSAGKQGGTKAVLNDIEYVVADRETYISLRDQGAEFLSQSYLFWEFVLCLDHARSFNPDVKFLLENVKMSKNNLDMITDALGVEPVFINSALVSAQNRQRYYWNNWVVEQPDDRGIFLADVLEYDGIGVIKNKGRYSVRSEKAMCLDANYYKGVDNHGQRTQIAVAYNRIKGVGRELTKAYPLNATDWRGLNLNQTQTAVLDVDGTPRKLTPIECERLQTVSDNYTDHVSNTQRYKMLGNGWTVDVIKHILDSSGLHYETTPTPATAPRISA